MESGFKECYDELKKFLLKKGFITKDNKVKAQKDQTDDDNILIETITQILVTPNSETQLDKLFKDLLISFDFGNPGKNADLKDLGTLLKMAGKVSPNFLFEIILTLREMLTNINEGYTIDLGEFDKNGPGKDNENFLFLFSQVAALNFVKFNFDYLKTRVGKDLKEITSIVQTLRISNNHSLNDSFIKSYCAFAEKLIQSMSFELIECLMNVREGKEEENLKKFISLESVNESMVLRITELVKKKNNILNFLIEKKATGLNEFLNLMKIISNIKDSKVSSETLMNKFYGLIKGKENEDEIHLISETLVLLLKVFWGKKKPYQDLLQECFGIRGNKKKEKEFKEDFSKLKITEHQADIIYLFFFGRKDADPLIISQGINHYKSKGIKDIDNLNYFFDLLLSQKDENVIVNLLNSWSTLLIFQDMIITEKDFYEKIDKKNGCNKRLALLRHFYSLKFFDNEHSAFLNSSYFEETDLMLNLIKNNLNLLILKKKDLFDFIENVENNNDLLEIIYYDNKEMLEERKEFNLKAKERIEKAEELINLNSQFLSIFFPDDEDEDDKNKELIKKINEENLAQIVQYFPYINELALKEAYTRKLVYLKKSFFFSCLLEKNEKISKEYYVEVVESFEKTKCLLDLKTFDNFDKNLVHLLFPVEEFKDEENILKEIDFLQENFKTKVDKKNIPKIQKYFNLLNELKKMEKKIEKLMLFLDFYKVKKTEYSENLEKFKRELSTLDGNIQSFQKIKITKIEETVQLKENTFIFSLVEEVFPSKIKERGEKEFVEKEENILVFLKDKSSEEAPNLFDFLEEFEDSGNEVEYVKNFINVVFFFEKIKEASKERLPREKNLVPVTDRQFVEKIKVIQGSNPDFEGMINYTKLVYKNMGLIDKLYEKLDQIEYSKKIVKSLLYESNLNFISDEDTWKIFYVPITKKNERKDTDTCKLEDLYEIQEKLTLAQNYKKNYEKEEDGEEEEKDEREEEEKNEKEKKEFLLDFKIFNLFVDRMKELNEKAEKLLTKGIPRNEYKITIRGKVINLRINEKDEPKKVEEEIKSLKEIIKQVEEAEIHVYTKAGKLSRYLYGDHFHRIYEYIYPNQEYDNNNDDDNDSKSKNKIFVENFLRYLTLQKNCKIPKFIRKKTYENDNKFINKYEEVVDFIEEVFEENEVKEEDLFKNFIIQKPNVPFITMVCLKDYAKNKKANKQMCLKGYKENDPLKFLELAILSRYEDFEEKTIFPIWHLVLMCNKATTEDEILCFLYRAFLCEYKVTFVICQIENLNYLQMKYLFDKIKEFYESSKNSNITAKLSFIYYREELEVIQYLKGSFDKNKKNELEFSDKNRTDKKKITETLQDQAIEVVSSEYSGLGKSYYIQRNIKNNYFYFPVGAIIRKEKLFTRFLELSQKNVYLHLDLITDQEMEGQKEKIREFLFKLLILKSYQYENNYVYLGNFEKIFIEVPNGFFDFLENFQFLSCFKSKKIGVNEKYEGTESELSKVSSNLEVVCNYILNKEYLSRKDLYIKGVSSDDYSRGLTIFAKALPKEECQAQLNKEDPGLFEEEGKEMKMNFYQKKSRVDLLGENLKLFTNDVYLKASELSGRSNRYKLLENRNIFFKSSVYLTKKILETSNYEKLIKQQENVRTGGSQEEEKDLGDLKKIKFEDIEESLVFLNEDGFTLTIIPIFPSDTNTAEKKPSPENKTVGRETQLEKETPLGRQSESTIGRQSESTIGRQSESTIGKQSESTIGKQSESTIGKQSESTIGKQSESTIGKQSTPRNKALENKNFYEKLTFLLNSNYEGMKNAEKLIDYSKETNEDIFFERLRYVLGQNIDIPKKAKYVFTADNFIKAIFIILRIRAKIPVIMMGETGCGKTSLIEEIARIKNPNKELKKLEIDGGFNDQRIIDFVNKIQSEVSEKIKAKEKDKRKATQPEYVEWVFLDEINTCNSLELISEILVKHTMHGKPILPNISFIAACNPYRVVPESLKKVGLIHEEDLEKTQLMYTVNPLPKSLLNYVLYFGNLSKEDEERYIQTILIKKRKKLNENKYGEFQITLDDERIVKTISLCHEKIRTVNGVASISLRDITRFIDFYTYFREYLKTKKDVEQSQISESEIHYRAVILSIYISYYIRLLKSDSRRELINEIESNLNSLTNLKFSEVVEEEHNYIAKNIMEDAKGIALNRILKENLFCAFICIINKKALYICGKPGCSKSLTISRLSKVMKGNASENKLFKNYPELHITTYQGSKTSTSQGIRKSFLKADRMIQNFNKTKKSNKVKQPLSLIYFDEMGLAEKSKANPLKTLHYLLEVSEKEEKKKEKEKHQEKEEEKQQEEERQRKPKKKKKKSLEDEEEEETEEKSEIQNLKDISFVGISNWKLDASKMNRGVFLAIPEFSLEDIEETAEQIFFSYFQEVISENDKPRYKLKYGVYYESLSKAYFDFIKRFENASKANPKEKKKKRYEENFHGSRDFYHLIKNFARNVYALIVEKVTKDIPENEDGKEEEEETIVIRNIVDDTLLNLCIDSLQRNFGGLEDSIYKIQSYFISCMRSKNNNREEGAINFSEGSFKEQEEFPYSLENCIRKNLRDFESRYLLLISNPSILPYLILNFVNTDTPTDKKYFFFLGSQFEEDFHNKNYHLSVLGKIKMILLQPEAVLILQNFEYLYPSFYDLFNQNYTVMKGVNYARLALESSTVSLTKVENTLRCVVLVDEKEVQKEDPPFLNRFEKHIASFSSITSREPKIKENAEKFYKKLVELLDLENNLKTNLNLRELVKNFELDEFIGILHNTRKKGKFDYSYEDCEKKLLEKIVPTFPEDLILLFNLFSEEESLPPYLKPFIKKINSIYQQTSRYNITEFLKSSVLTGKTKHIVYTFSNLFEKVELSKEIKYMQNGEEVSITSDTIKELSISSCKISNDVEKEIKSFLKSSSPETLFVIKLKEEELKHLSFLKFLIENLETDFENSEIAINGKYNRKQFIILVGLKRATRAKETPGKESKKEEKREDKFFISHLAKDFDQAFIDNINQSFSEVDFYKLINLKGNELFENTQLLDFITEGLNSLHSGFRKIRFSVFNDSFSKDKEEYSECIKNLASKTLKENQKFCELMKNLIAKDFEEKCTLEVVKNLFSMPTIQFEVDFLSAIKKKYLNFINVIFQKVIIELSRKNLAEIAFQKNLFEDNYEKMKYFFENLSLNEVQIPEDARQTSCQIVSGLRVPYSWIIFGKIITISDDFFKESTQKEPKTLEKEKETLNEIQKNYRNFQLEKFKFEDLVHDFCLVFLSKYQKSINFSKNAIQVLIKIYSDIAKDLNTSGEQDSINSLIHLSFFLLQKIDEFDSISRIINELEKVDKDSDVYEKICAINQEKASDVVLSLTEKLITLSINYIRSPLVQTEKGPHEKIVQNGKQIYRALNKVSVQIAYLELFIFFIDKLDFKAEESMPKEIFKYMEEYIASVKENKLEEVISTIKKEKEYLKSLCQNSADIEAECVIKLLETHLEISSEEKIKDFCISLALIDDNTKRKALPLLERFFIKYDKMFDFKDYKDESEFLSKFEILKELEDNENFQFLKNKDDEVITQFLLYIFEIKVTQSLMNIKIKTNENDSIYQMLEKSFQIVSQYLQGEQTQIYHPQLLLYISYLKGYLNKIGAEVAAALNKNEKAPSFARISELLFGDSSSTLTLHKFLKYYLVKVINHNLNNFFSYEKFRKSAPKEIEWINNEEFMPNNPFREIFTGDILEIKEDEYLDSYYSLIKSDDLQNSIAKKPVLQDIQICSIFNELFFDEKHKERLGKIKELSSSFTGTDKIFDYLYSQEKFEKYTSTQIYVLLLISRMKRYIIDEVGKKIHDIYTNKKGENFKKENLENVLNFGMTEGLILCSCGNGVLVGNCGIPRAKMICEKCHGEIGPESGHKLLEGNYLVCENEEDRKKKLSMIFGPINEDKMILLSELKEIYENLLEKAIIKKKKESYEKIKKSFENADKNWYLCKCGECYESEEEFPTQKIVCKNCKKEAGGENGIIMEGNCLICKDEATKTKKIDSYSIKNKDNKENIISLQDLEKSLNYFKDEEKDPLTKLLLIFTGLAYNFYVEVKEGTNAEKEKKETEQKETKQKETEHKEEVFKKIQEKWALLEVELKEKSINNIGIFFNFILSKMAKEGTPKFETIEGIFKSSLEEYNTYYKKYVEIVPKIVGEKGCYLNEIYFSQEKNQLEMYLKYFYQTISPSKEQLKFVELSEKYKKLYPYLNACLDSFTQNSVKLSKEFSNINPFVNDMIDIYSSKIRRDEAMETSMEDALAKIEDITPGGKGPRMRKEFQKFLSSWDKVRSKATQWECQNLEELKDNFDFKTDISFLLNNTKVKGQGMYIASFYSRIITFQNVVLVRINNNINAAHPLYNLQKSFSEEIIIQEARNADIITFEMKDIEEIIRNNINIYIPSSAENLFTLRTLSYDVSKIDEKIGKQFFVRKKFFSEKQKEVSYPGEEDTEDLREFKNYYLEPLMTEVRKEVKNYFSTQTDLDLFLATSYNLMHEVLIYNKKYPNDKIKKDDKIITLPFKNFNKNQIFTEFFKKFQDLKVSNLSEIISICCSSKGAPGQIKLTKEQKDKIDEFFTTEFLVLKKGLLLKILEEFIQKYPNEEKKGKEELEYIFDLCMDEFLDANEIEKNNKIRKQVEELNEKINGNIVEVSHDLYLLL